MVYILYALLVSWSCLPQFLSQRIAAQPVLVDHARAVVGTSPGTIQFCHFIWSRNAGAYRRAVSHLCAGVTGTGSCEPSFLSTAIAVEQVKKKKNKFKPDWESAFNEDCEYIIYLPEGLYEKVFSHMRRAFP